MRILCVALAMGLCLPTFSQTSARPNLTPTVQNKPAYKELTGVWRGQFFAEGRPGRNRTYRYEVQFLQKGNGSLKGVTYSWQNDIGFYGKANGSGIYMQNANTLVLKETELEEVKMSGNSAGCLMTCYLDFSLEGNKQVLTGTYTSVESTNPQKDCGNGTVRLEKVPDSDFGIEPYILERLQEIERTEKAKLSRAKPAPKPPVAKAKPAVKKVPTVVAKAKPSKPAAPALSTPQAEPTTATRPAESRPQSIAPTKPAPQPKQVVKLPPPPVFNQRKTQIEKTYVINEKTATISFYDMGDIDGDEISVYLNNNLVLNKTKLTARANAITLQLSDEDPVQEITVVAENMGTIPPNTAFVVIEAGSARYEVTLTSNMEKNARVLVEYRPKLAQK